MKNNSVKIKCSFILSKTEIFLLISIIYVRFFSSHSSLFNIRSEGFICFFFVKLRPFDVACLFFPLYVFISMRQESISKKGF